MARIVDHLPVSGAEQHRQPHSTAGLMSSRRQRLDGHRCAGDVGIPPIRFPIDGDRLGSTYQRTMEARTNTADRGETEHATIQHGAIAILRIGADVLAVLGLEAQLAWGVSMAHAADDG